MRRMKLTIALILLSLNLSAQQYLLIGTDTRDKNSKGNADLIMILTINKGSIKLTSIMRDTYVFIKGHGNKKINAAYSIGGRGLLISTINNNFKTHLTNSIAVDFSNSAALADCLGGLNVYVEPDLMQHMNNYIKEQAYLKHTTPNLLTKSGELLLTGDQILAYTRVRAKGYDDYARVIRQRQILMLLIKAISHDKTKALTCFGSIWNTFDTDIEYSAFTKTFKAMIGNKAWPESSTFPDANYATQTRINGSSVLKIKDFKKASVKLNQLIR